MPLAGLPRPQKTPSELLIEIEFLDARAIRTPFPFPKPPFPQINEETMGQRRSKERSEEKVEFHLSKQDIAHRQDFAQFARNHSEEWYRLRLERLYQRWNEWNQEFFDGKMAEPYLMISSLTGKGTMGLYQTISSFGGKSVIRINRLILTGQFPGCANGNQDPEGLMRIAEDTLLHEMIHQHAHEHLFQPEPSQRGHGVVFRDECNRIAAQIGWETEVRIAKKTKTNAHIPSCAHWPDGVRPDPLGYYRGAWKPEAPVQKREENPEEGEEETQPLEAQNVKISKGEWTTLFSELDGLSKKAQTVIVKLAKLHGAIPTRS